MKMEKITLDRLHGMGETISSLNLSYDSNEVALWEAHLSDSLNGLFEISYPQEARGSFAIHLICKHIFIEKIPIRSKYSINGYIQFFTGIRGNRKWESSDLNINIDIDVPDKSFSIVEPPPDLHFDNRSDAKYIVIYNESDAPTFFTVSPSGNLSNILDVTYEKQAEAYEASQIVPPGGHLRVKLMPKRRSRSGDYNGHLAIMDAFGRHEELDTKVSLNFPSRFILGRLKDRKRKKRQEGIENRIVQYAAQNSGMISQSEINGLFSDINAKEVLSALKRLEDEGLVERSEGVFIFTQLVDF